MTRILVVVMVIAGCSAGEADPTTRSKPERRWKTDGHRDTTPQERMAARAALAAAKLDLTDAWVEGAARDGERAFIADSVEIELYLANAEELVAVADEPPSSLAELVARAQPTSRDGWPWVIRRLGQVTDQGENGSTFWVAGPLEENYHCSDPGCREVWEAQRGKRGFVVVRTLGMHRFRCAASGFEGPVLAQAFAACKTFTMK